MKNLFTLTRPRAFAFAAPAFAFVFFFLATCSQAQTFQLDLDRESLDCVNCHDAAVTPGDPFEVCHEEGCDHRIGIDYALAASRDRSLVPPARLNPAIKLVNNRISCVTCHVPYSADNHEVLAGKRKLIPQIPDPMLTVDNAGSALCRGCHNR